MRSTTGKVFPDGAADLARLILDAIELAVAHERWEVADRLLCALEELKEESGDAASLDSAYESVARMLGASVNDGRCH